MKISLIAVLAAIAGCALATRGPLYARALEHVNSFERDLDVYPRESGVAVQARDLKPPPYAGTLVHITGHNTAARYQQRAARKNEKAAKAAHKLSQKTTGEASQMWKDMAADRKTMAEAHVVDWKSHHDAMISGPHEGTPLVRSSIREASKSIAEAEYVYSMAKVHGERLQNASQAASKGRRT